ncbi:MAG: Small heat shock protein [uncultured bacterium]|nr:MAG: Small heat shock protein [uncultured bacterium]KKT72699.1 MAG: Protein containing Heat shock protein Hsp20 protein [Candidatus Peregrinibacteria bacterium GW2011_GWA2_44_7]
MKPIGIGKLKISADRKDQTISRHHFEPSELTPLAGTPIQVQNFSTHATDEPEGQLSVDVYQTDNEIFIVAPVAGTSADQVSISITDDVITIKGRREMNKRDLLHNAELYLEECFWGPFSRSIVLPTAVDTGHVEAYFKNNVLTVRIPKTERIRTRVIRITQE